MVFAAVWISACGDSGSSRITADPEAIRSFYVGLAALDVGDDRRARSELEKVTTLAADEPAGWNNYGVLLLRQRDLNASGPAFDRAAQLDPNNPSISLNRAILYLQTGQDRDAAKELERTINLTSGGDKVAKYMLAELREREANGKAALEIYRTIDSGNIAVLIEVARLEAKLGLTDDLQNTLTHLKERSIRFPSEAQEVFGQFSAAAERNDTRAAQTQISFLRNVLLREPWFREAIAEFKPSDTAVGRPIYKPLRLETVGSKAAEPDRELSFDTEKRSKDEVLFSFPFYLNGDEPPMLAIAGKTGLKIGEIRLEVEPEFPKQIAVFDLDYDFRNDLAIATKNGFRLFTQSEPGKFADATTKTKLAPEILRGTYTGIWTIDIEHDGDLDLVLAREDGSFIGLQNNSDGTFRAVSLFSDPRKPADLIYADIDEDGDADAIILTIDGRLQVFSNERGGKFLQRNMPDVSGLKAFAVGDVTGDSKLDIVAVGDAIYRISDVGAGSDWEVAPFDGMSDELKCPVNSSGSDECSIFIADIDNNGSNDIIFSGAGAVRILSAAGGDKYEFLGGPITGRVNGIADINGDGKLDLIGKDIEGAAAVFMNRSSKNYRWQIFRPRAGKTEGDQRVNSFGIGGEMEIRTGVRTQKQLISSPRVHFGLGEAAATDVLRIIWNNGFVQAEFDLEADQVIAAEQRLKGSCPHLFTWNGERFVMVKDAPPWSPALGLKINAQDIAGVMQTEEWFKIPGETVKPKDGAYEFRITGEYWESFYIDHYKLMVIDHPEATEIFTDERFAVPPPPLKVHTTGAAHPFANVFDHNGNDVSETVRAIDEVYLDGIERGKFQGVAEDHWAEFVLPEDAPADKALMLIADGWLHPTDASINVQLGQSSFTPPKSLSLEVPNGDGWRSVKENLGFPAGKMKTILVELPSGERRFRLRTNMEIYWDRLTWAEIKDGSEDRTTTIELGSAELRYRGFSVIEKGNASSPEKPIYDQILTTGQRWRDLEGYYTRFGDVRELLAGVDGRMVLMNAGDELILRFPALPDPPAGYKRDLVFVGNGWIKDGDLNSVFSKTLLPLPRHDSNDYTVPPTRLEDDPVYRRHKADWVNFHTRYVAPDGFRNRVRRP